MDNSDRRNQKNYRSLLQAMSRPGRVFRLDALGAVSSFAARWPSESVCWTRR